MNLYTYNILRRIFIYENEQCIDLNDMNNLNLTKDIKVIIDSYSKCEYISAVDIMAIIYLFTLKNMDAQFPDLIKAILKNPNGTSQVGVLQIYQYLLDLKYKNHLKPFPENLGKKIMLAFITNHIEEDKEFTHCDEKY